MCVWVFCLHVCLCTMCVQYPWGLEENIGFPGTRVIDGYESPYGCWESNLGLVGEQLVFLTAQPSLAYFHSALPVGPALNYSGAWKGDLSLLGMDLEVAFKLKNPTQPSWRLSRAVKQGGCNVKGFVSKPVLSKAAWEHFGVPVAPSHWAEEKCHNCCPVQTSHSTLSQAVTAFWVQTDDSRQLSCSSTGSHACLLGVPVGKKSLVMRRCSGFGRVSHKTCFVFKMVLVYGLGLVLLPCQIHCKGYRFAPPCLVQYRSLMLTQYLDFIGIRIIRK